MYIYHVSIFILLFWLVTTYNLLEDRCTTDMIITKICPLCFKMVESFEYLDNIFCDWVKDKAQKGLVKALNRFEKQEEEILENDSEKCLSSLSQQTSETKPNTKLVLKLLWGKKSLLCLEFSKPNKQNVSDIYLKRFIFSQSQNNCWHRLMLGMKHQWHTPLSPHVPLFCSYHILTWSFIWYWTDARQHRI